MSSAESVCLFVCQYDNFQISKHRTIKLGGRCTVQKSPLSSNLEVIAQGGAPPAPAEKCGVRLGRWENQRRLSSLLYATHKVNSAWPSLHETLHPCQAGHERNAKQKLSQNDIPEFTIFLTHNAQLLSLVLTHVQPFSGPATECDFQTTKWVYNLVHADIKSRQLLTIRHFRSTATL